MGIGDGFKNLKTWFEKINKTEERRLLRERLAEERKRRKENQGTPTQNLKARACSIYEIYKPGVTKILHSGSVATQEYIDAVYSYFQSSTHDIDEVISFTMRPLNCLAAGMECELQKESELDIFNNYVGAVSFARQIDKMSKGLFLDMTSFVVSAVNDYYFHRSRDYQKYKKRLLSETRFQESVTQSDFIRKQADQEGVEDKSYFAQYVRFLIDRMVDEGILSKTKKGNSYQLTIQ